jgi:PAS domain S-box-containing protein
MRILFLAEAHKGELLVTRQIADALTQMHAQVEMIESSRAFELVLAQDGYDAAVVGLCLEWGDGLAAGRALLRRNPRLPVVMVTACGDERSAVDAMKSGFADYLPAGELNRLAPVLQEAVKSSRAKGAVSLKTAPAHPPAIRAHRRREKRVELISRRGERVFSRLFHANPIPMAITGWQDGRFLEMNQAFEAFMGADRKTMMGKTMAELGMVYPLPERAELLQALADRPSWRNVELAVPTLRNGPRTVEAYFEILHVHGQKAILTMLVDMTDSHAARDALRINEMKLNSVIEQSLDGIAMFDPQGCVTAWNHSMERITGRSAADALGRPVVEEFLRLLPEHQRTNTAFLARYQNMVEELLENPKWHINRVIEHSIQNQAGEERALHTVIFPVVLEGGNNWGVVMRDMTEQRQVERLVHETEKLAITGRMAGQIAHEINNPLAGIKNAFLLIEDSIPRDHAYYPYVQRIKNEIDRMARFVQQMYTLYRPERSRRLAAELPVVIQDVLLVLQSEARHLGVVIEFTPPPGGCTFMVEEASLKQVLYNLLRNALEASPAGSTVHVTLARQVGHVTIAVEDQGQGITPKAAGRVFEPFFTTKHNKERSGMGLGLPISLSLVQNMGGTLTFTSKVGRGTRFVISLPESYHPEE